MSKTIAYIGTWGNDLQGGDKGKAVAAGGIQVFHLDTDKHLHFVSSVTPQVNSGILCCSPDKKFLYSTDERKDLNGVYGNGGGVCAYKVNQSDGSLEFLNEVSSAGAYPCYIAIDAGQRFLFVSNHANHEDAVTKSVCTPEGAYKAVRVFDEGSIAMFPILEDGFVGECCDLKVLAGSSIKEWYQWTPHPHSVKLDPSNTFLLSGDKGSDKIYVFRVDYEHGKLIEAYCENAKPGSGPRHIAFHPSLPFVYINSELDSTVHSFEMNFYNGSLRHMSKAKTIPVPYVPPDPDDQFAKNETADIRVHKSGRFLYVSNRGHNSIAIFILDENGNIEHVDRISSGGEIPRAIGFDLSGDTLYAVNQRSGNIAQFSVDEASGRLTPTGYELRLNNPVCIDFIKLN